jgi:bromodomain adjacent to zinc finger domain protein 1A
LVSDLVKHEDSWPFLKPVSKKDSKEYLKLVNNKPMNLATIKNNLINYKYNDYKLIINDLKLIFTNCNLYFDKTSDEYKSGKILFDYFNQQATQYELV